VGADKLLLVVMISSLPKSRASIENTDFSATVFLKQFGTISENSYGYNRGSPTRRAPQFFTKIAGAKLDWENY